MKTFGGTIGERQRAQGLVQQGFQVAPEPDSDGMVSVDDVTPGMVLSLPREKTALGSMQRAKNARSRDNWIGRRPGTGVFIAKPDSNPVTRIITFVTASGDVWLLRFTPTALHGTQVNDAWFPMTHNLVGVGERFDYTQMEGYLFLANGEEQVRYIDFPSRSLKFVEGAPRGRFITTFADRVIVANLRKQVGGIIPFGLDWSMSGNPFNWTDISAGGVDLPQGGRGRSSDITGLFGLGELVILRRNSIWQASRQPFATNPLRFTQVIDNIGCDMPETADAFDSGVFFADYFSKGVYLYQLGSRPERISRAIEPELFQDLQNLHWAEGAFDPFEQEYHLGLTTLDGDQWINKVWVFSLRTGAWTFDDGPRVSTLGVVTVPTADLTIDEGIGTINEQVGTIDGTASDLLTPGMFKGTPTGEVLQQSYSFDQDFGGVVFEMELISQNMGNPTQERVMKEVMAKVLSSKVGQVAIAHSKDGIEWRSEKVVPLITSSARQDVRLPQQLTGEDLYFRLRSTMSDVKLTSFWIRVMDGSEHT